MKFINKQTDFQSHKSPYPRYNNSYVRDGKIEIGENKQYLSINYLFCHEVPLEMGKNEVKEVVINRQDKSELRFTESHVPTTIDDGNGNEVEVYEAILSGITYDKTKIINWGKPSIEKVLQMFKLESIGNKETGLQLNEMTEISVQGQITTTTQAQQDQIRQLMIDWLSEFVIIENEKLGVNFDVVENQS